MTVETKVDIEGGQVKGDISQAISKYGDQSESLTIEEEQAVKEIATLIAAEFPEDKEMWRKLSHKKVLIFLLRMCKLDAKLAVECIKKLFHHTTITYPELFVPIDPPNLKHLWNKNMFQVVRRFNDDGPTVLVFRLKHWDPATATIEEITFSAILYLFTVFKFSPKIQSNGFVVVNDIEGFRFAHARTLSVDIFLKAVRIYTSVPPVIHGIHVFNSMFLFDRTFGLLKWILPQSIRSLINVTKKDMTFLNKLVGKESLPKEFGGTVPDNEAYYDHIEEELKDDTLLIGVVEKSLNWFFKHNNVSKKMK